MLLGLFAELGGRGNSSTSSVSPPPYVRISTSLYPALLADWGLVLVVLLVETGFCGYDLALAAAARLVQFDRGVNNDRDWGDVGGGATVLFSDGELTLGLLDRQMETSLIRLFPREETERGVGSGVSFCDVVSCTEELEVGVG